MEPTAPVEGAKTEETDDLLPPLPAWNDAASIASWVTALLALAFGVVAYLHPGIKESAEVQTLVPIFATVVAGLVQAVNVVTHRSLLKIEHLTRRPQ